MFLSMSSCTLVIRSRGIVEMVRATEGRGALSVSTPSMFLPLSSTLVASRIVRPIPKNGTVANSGSSHFVHELGVGRR